MSRENAVHVLLEIFTGRRVRAEPCYDLRVDTDGNLIAGSRVKEPAFGARPVADFGNIGSVDRIVGQSRKSFEALMILPTAASDLPFYRESVNHQDQKRPDAPNRLPSISVRIGVEPRRMKGVFKY